VARFLALDWDHNQLHAVLANVSGGSVRVLRAASWTEEAPLSGAAAAGERLKERLKEAKMTAAPVLASLGRERLIVREIRYPAVPPHEEPAIVRFQALKELTGSADDVVLDYTPAGEGSHGERRSLVHVARREHVIAYQDLCRAAGLKLAGVTPRAFGLATGIERLVGTSVLTPPPEPADAAVGVLAVGDGWAEFCVSRTGTVLLARSLTPGPNLAAEVRRTLAVYAGQNAEQPVRAVYVAGGADNAALRERLHNLLDLPIHLLDPFSGAEEPDQPAPEKRGGFVGLVGLLYLRGGKAGLPVNFIAPKQPKPPQDPNKRKVLLGVAAAAAVLLAIGMLIWLQLGRLDKQVKAQMALNRELDNQLGFAEDDDKRYVAVKAWTDSTVVKLDELYDLTDRFPDPDASGVRLSLLTITDVDRPANAKDADKAKDKDKRISRMSLKGVCKDDYHPVDQLVQRFVEDGRYHPDPKRLSRNTGPDRRNGYTQEWTVDKIDIDRRDPKDYTRHMEDDQVAKEKERQKERERERGRGGRGGRDRGGDRARRPGGDAQQ
jgi:Tfp pilus assembly PilM family ATPase